MKKFSMLAVLTAIGATITAWVLEEHRQALKEEIHLRDMEERRHDPCCGCNGAEVNRCDGCIYRCFANNLDRAEMFEVRQITPVLSDCKGCLYSAFCFNYRNLKRVINQADSVDEVLNTEADKTEDNTI